MKNILLLTSLLALSACMFSSGGGNGGSGVQGEVYSASSIQGPNITSDAAVASNREITGMTSSIVVANDGASSAIRSGSVHHMGKTYNIYDLSDVEFRIAENPTMGNFQFKVDAEGRIAQIQETLGAATDTINRIGNTQRFNGPMFEYVSNTNDGNVSYRIVDGTTFDDSIETEIPGFTATLVNGMITMGTLNLIASTKGLTGGHWNRIDEILDIDTVGNSVGSGTGLTFSDFGKFNPVYRSKHKNIDATMLAAIRATDTNIKNYLDNNDTEGLITYLQAYASGLLSLDEHGDPDLHSGSHTYNTASEREYEFAHSQDYQLFAGGYAIKDGQIVETLTPTNGMQFSGKAIGRVYSSIQKSSGPDRAALLSQYGLDVAQPIYSIVGGDPIYWYKGHTYADETTLNAALALDFDDPDDYPEALDANDVAHDMAAFYQTANNGATLDVDSETGDVTLVMPFTDFYTVTATQEAGADEATVTFTNKNENLPDYLARDSDASVSTDTFYFGYYGIDTPTEAAGTIMVEDTETALNVATPDPTNPTADPIATTSGTREWEFQGAYGMTLSSNNN